MKTFTFAALFACLLVASALADSGDSGRPGGFGAGGSRPGQPGGAAGGAAGGTAGGATGGTGGSTVEEDDMATLFNSIGGTNGILGADTFSQLSAATSGHDGLEKLEINLNIKVVLVKIGGQTYRLS